MVDGSAPVRLAFDILLGAGLAGAAGLRPFLPALLAGALASQNVGVHLGRTSSIGVDFEGTPYAFLQSGWFLLAVLALLVVTVVVQRRAGAEALETGAFGAALAGVSLGLGALLFAGALADDGYASWPGLIAGLAFAAVAQAAARNLFARVRARLDKAARDALVLYADAASLVGAAAAILFPPLSILTIGFLAWLLAGGRRRGGEKHAGLRILR